MKRSKELFKNFSILPTPTPTEWRLVGFIYPDSFFKTMMDDDWKKTVRMASNTEQEHPNLRYKVLAVGPATGDVYSRMPYMDNVYFPEDCALEHFNVFLEKTKAAITQEPLFRESFTDLGVWEDG